MPAEKPDTYRVTRLLCAIYDKRARMWGDITSAFNADVAARMVQSLVSRPGTLYHDYATDYALYQVGVCTETCSDSSMSLQVSSCPTTLLYEFAAFVNGDGDRGVGHE